MNAFIRLYSNVNSSVYPFIDHKKIPAQKPMHRGQWNNSPNLPLVGLMGLKMDPYKRMKVKP